MDRIRKRLEEDRKELLDLSMRNTLLNFKPLRSKGLKIEDELSDQVLRILVSKGSRMSFLHAPEPEDDGDDDLAPSSDGHSVLRVTEDLLWLFQQPEDEPPVPGQEENGKPAARHVDNKLQTPHSNTRLQRRLLNSYYASRTTLEEHGVNTLFLALGFLKWYEAESSDEARLAPLILVPVALSRASVKAKFRLEFTGDELGTNLSLQEKLRLEFGLSLPDFEPTDDDGVTQYFEAVTKVVSCLPRWSIESNEIHLGFFWFTKLLMYKDLDPESWPEDRKPMDHPVLAALLGDGFGDSTPTYLPPENLDEVVQPQDSTHIWDADSSQTVALLSAVGGKNLVVQGPPGTGKSQTITNLIADSVMTGKRVLFVAEKMAALEVVKRRLDNAHVGEICLELHSHKSNKASVLEELERTVKLGCPEYPEVVSELRELGVTLESLNTYCRSIHRPIRESSTSPYQAYGALLRIRRETSGESLPKIDNEDLRHWPRDVFQSRLEKVKRFKAALGSIGVPADHIFWGSEASMFLPADAPQIAESASEALQALIRFEEATASLARELGLDLSRNRVDTDRTLEAARRAAKAPSLEGIDIKAPAWRSERDDVESTILQGGDLQQIRRRHDSLLLPKSWDGDVLRTRSEYGRSGDKWWRFLSRRYWSARRHLLALFRETPPKSNRDRVAVLDNILEAQRLTVSLAGKEDLIRSLLGTHWQGFESDFSLIGDITAYLLDLHEAIAASETPTDLLDYLSCEQDPNALSPRINDVEKSGEELEAALLAAWERVRFSEQRRFGCPVAHVDFSDLATLLSQWASHPEALREMAQFNTWAGDLAAESLSGLVSASESWAAASRHVDHLLEKAWYEGLVQEALAERPELRMFDSAVHAKTLQRFCELDRWLIGRNRVRLAQHHWAGLPKTGSGGQLGILKREFAKRRRQKRIRQLLTEAGRAIQQIKPVFMMSPLSVAAYLPQDGIEFDLVIFDEASQITPVDAYGALLRANQAVVVGDSKQLPPTPFFAKLSEDEDREEDQASDLESVLGLFDSCNAPSSMLGWHYRSQHESLIAVSNHEFYDGALVVFPSPDQTRKALGLIYRPVQGTFLRGKGRSYNPKEARFVAEAVMRHAREHSELTLGVAAFSQKQSQEIQNQVEYLRRESPETEGFFSAHPEEPYFVKNLENVQGDERDVIFISVGYGRDENDFISHNFGPLNRQGGERRLNVLITRAKMRCEVFTNLRADDIDLSKSNARGVKALKTFLKYARDGVLDIPVPSDLGPDSEFEVEVAHELVNLGYEIDGQVGSGGFFVDLAVKDDRAPGRYLLGIECDGATYHSAKWARDRDRLREEVLRRLGWEIHRIWSTDWFMNPEREIRKVQEAIEKARTLSEPTAHPPTDGNQGPALGVRRSEPNLVSNQPLKADPYNKAEVSVVSHDRVRLYEQRPEVIAPWVQQVVMVESPVHRVLVTARIAEASGLQAAHRRTREAIASGIRKAVGAGTVVARADFLWAPNAKAVLRDWSGLPPMQRKIELTAPEEVALAVLKVVEAAISMHRTEAAQLAGRLLGYQRIRRPIAEAIDAVISDLLTEGKLVRSAGELTLAR